MNGPAVVRFLKGGTGHAPAIALATRITASSFGGCTIRVSVMALVVVVMVVVVVVVVLVLVLVLVQLLLRLVSHLLLVLVVLVLVQVLVATVAVSTPRRNIPYTGSPSERFKTYALATF
jgi:hypothetical protein